MSTATQKGITVRVPRPSGAASLARLLLLLGLASMLGSPETAAAVSFDPPQAVAMPGPGAGDRLAAGDLTLDCAIDLVNMRDLSVAAEDPSLNVLLGDGQAGFPDIRGMSGGFTLSDFEFADLDGDGILDLVTTEEFDPQGAPFGICQSPLPKVPVFLGDGAGNFVLQDCLTARDHPATLVTGDFNEDGATDLVVANAPTAQSGATSPDVLLFRGRGDGSFHAGQWLLGQRADDLAAADFDGDGHLDLAMAVRTTTYVFLGAGDGTFARVGATGVTGGARRLAIGDVNGDGAPDVLAVGSLPQQFDDDYLWVALNLDDGTGGFVFGAAYPVGNHPVGVAAADLDLDGYDDVVVANNLGDTVSIFLGHASGTLQAEQVFDAGRDPMAVVVADLDRNGLPDVAVANRNVAADGSVDDGSITMLMQQSASPLGVRTAALPCAAVDRPYHACLEAAGGNPPYSWSVTSGALPDGLLLDGPSGRIHGTPATGGSGSLTAGVNDSIAASASRPLAWDVGEDLDGDGFTTCEGDCDDLDGNRFPALRETCDGVDNDCDGTVDAGLDTDGDLIDDLCDNCPSLDNPDQRDGDGDGVGTACDTNPIYTVSSNPADGADFASIQEAVNAAAESGTRIQIRLGSGTYAENVVIDRNLAFDLVFAGGAGSRPVIDGGAGPAVTVLSKRGGRPFELSGLILRGVTGFLAGVSSRVSDCSFRSIADFAIDLTGGDHEVGGVDMDGTVHSGLRLAAGASLAMEASRIEGIGGDGADISGAASLETVLIAGGAGNGIVTRSGGSTALLHGTVADNGLAGLDIVAGGSATVSGSILFGNVGGDLLGGSCGEVFWSDLGSPDCTGFNRNLSEDPVFATGYRLSGSSGCLDLGPDPATYDGTPCLDLDGAPRLLDHDGDGLARADAGVFERSNPALLPPAVGGLSWASNATLLWTAEPTAARYHVYRDVLDNLSYASFGSCRDDLDPDPTDTMLTDAEDPLPGTGFFYVVTAEDAAPEESSLGLGRCAERSNFAACPLAPPPAEAPPPPDPVRSRSRILR